MDQEPPCPTVLPATASVVPEPAEPLPEHPRAPEGAQKHSPQAAAAAAASPELAPSAHAAATPQNPAADKQQGGEAQASSLADCLLLLQDNATAIATAEEVLQHLLAKQSSLMLLERRLEQERVLEAVRHPLGFSGGRPVAAVLLLRCLQQWGLLHSDHAPILEHLASVMQHQLDAEDESAPAEVAGLQCNVAYWLTVSAVLLCLLLKTTQPDLAAAALRQSEAHGKHGGAAVAEEVRRKVGELQKQLSERVSHIGGLQALGKRFGWSKQQQQEQPPQHPAAIDAAADHPGDAAPASSSNNSSFAPAAGAAAPAADSVGSSFTSAAEAATVRPAPAAGGQGPLPPPLQFFMHCLDQQVQRCFVLLRDQLKRRIAPLLSDCMLNPSEPQQQEPADASSSSSSNPAAGSLPAAAAGGALSPPLSPSAAGAAVAGTAAACAATAEPLLLAFRSWSELVGVLHAALVALRDAGVPRQLRASLMQQVLAFVNCQLFNQLLLRPECCSAANSRHALRGLKQLDSWILQESSIGGSSSGSSSNGPWLHADNGGGRDSGSCRAGAQQAAAGPSAAGDAAAAAAASEGWEEVAPPTPADAGEFDSWVPPPAHHHHHQQQQQQQQPWWRRQRKPDQQQQAASQHEMGPEAWRALSHTRQALQFLVLPHKGSLTLEDLADHLCPALSPQQLYRLCTTAWDDTPNEDGVVSGEVLEAMKAAHTTALSSNGGLIVTFLLDEPAGLPFVAAGAGAAGGGSPSSTSSAAASCGRFGRCRARAIVTWDDRRDYGAGLALPQLPAALLEEGCPPEVWAFLAERQPWPWPVDGAGCAAH